MKMKSNIDDANIVSRPLKHKNGDVLNDVELCRQAVKNIDDYSKQYGKPPNIDPKFVSWLRQAVNYCANGGDIKTYKEQYIYKQYEPLYDEIIENTNKRNAVLNKKGAFKSKVIKTIKGESK